MADKPPAMANVDSVNSPVEVFHATAYCLTGITRSGVPTAPGRVAADPNIIPLGSMIYVETPWMSGIYQVMDTGDLIKGKIIDIFIPSYEKCMEFGRRIVKVKVLRYGFHNENAGKPANKNQ
jgi:3D (Asp-Asp-Asp) domain-containing protein